MTSTDYYEYFSNSLITIPLEQIKEKYSPLKEFRLYLKTTYEEIVKEARKNKEDYLKRGESYNSFFEGLKEKVENLIKDLIKKNPDGILYKDCTGREIPLSDTDNLLSSYASLIHEKLKDISSHFEKLSNQITPWQCKEVEAKKDSLKQPKATGIGFKIKNEHCIPEVHRLLKNGLVNFIAKDTPYSVFEKAFTGKLITKRITWMTSQFSLHYFIDGIYGKPGNYGLGVYHEVGGQWMKVIEVFIKNDGTLFNNNKLATANKKPTEEQIKKLDRIISLINKHPSK